jgi:hypothetical protein
MGFSSARHEDRGLRDVTKSFSECENASASLSSDEDRTTSSSFAYAAIFDITDKTTKLRGLKVVRG